MELVTNSRVASYRRCARLHRFRYVELLRPVHEHAPKRDWGTAVHLALELYHAMNGDVYRDGLGTWLGAHFFDELDPYAAMAARVVLAAYHAYWHQEDSACLTVGVEREFIAPLINPDTNAPSRTYRIGGKMDALRLDADGNAWVMEHKTTSSDITPGSAYWQRLRLDAQISIYLDAAPQLEELEGRPITGMVYDVIKRPSHEPLKATPLDARKYTQGKGCKLCGGKQGVQGSGSVGEALCNLCQGSGWTEAPRLYATQREVDETPEEYGERIAASIAIEPSAYFQRGVVVRSSDELIDARRDMWQVVQAMHRAGRDGTDYRNPDACTNFGSVCAYMPICAREVSPDDDQRYYRDQNQHQELSLLTQLNLTESRKRAKKNDRTETNTTAQTTPTVASGAA